MQLLRTQDSAESRHFGTSAKVSVRHKYSHKYMSNCRDISVLVPNCIADISAPRKTAWYQATVSKIVPVYDVIVHTEWLVKHRPSRWWPGG